MAAELSRVRIEFCTQCQWLFRASWMAQELLSTFGRDLGEVALVPGTGGVYRITVDGIVIWDRKEQGGFPEITTLKKLVRDIVDPDRDLGHTDRPLSLAQTLPAGDGPVGLVEPRRDHADSPVVTTQYGDVRGVREANVLVWRAVPFAEPVTGARRFRAPMPPRRWEGTRDCTHYGEIAPQGAENPVPLDGLVPGENCLWLNVWAPVSAVDGGKARVSAPRPVLVWIHGGAYCLGSGAQKIYEGRNLVEIGDCIVVTINYRLGVLGFVNFSHLSTPEHTFESNLGLRDQIAALTWVRANIAAFGGDPEQVTVFGESSGAGSITTLMTSPAAAGLFQRAIAQSPPATSVYGAARGQTVARRFLELAGIGADDAAQLYSMPIDELIKHSDRLVNDISEHSPGTLATAPVVDGDIVPRYPVAAFQKGLSHPIPLIVGTNHDEAALFRLIRSRLLPVTPGAVNDMLRGIAADHPDLSHERLAEIVAEYPDLTTAKGALMLSGDAGFRMPAIWIAEAHSRHSPTWMYRFDQATPMLRAARVGASHATELPYVFGNFGTFNLDPTFWLGGRKAAMEVAARMQRRWIAFAAHGVPAAMDGSKHWPRYDEQTRQTLIIDAVDSVVSDPDGAARESWGERVLGFS